MIVDHFRQYIVPRDIQHKHFVLLDLVLILVCMARIHCHQNEERKFLQRILRTYRHLDVVVLVLQHKQAFRRKPKVKEDVKKVKKEKEITKKSQYMCHNK